MVGVWEDSFFMDDLLSCQLAGSFKTRATNELAGQPRCTRLASGRQNSAGEVKPQGQHAHLHTL